MSDNETYTAAGLAAALDSVRRATRAAIDRVPPLSVQLVAAEVALYCGARPDHLIVRDAEWGDVRAPGAWSIAYEGGPESWPVSFVGRALGRGLVPDGWMLEPVNGVCLGVYRD